LLLLAFLLLLLLMFFFPGVCVVSTNVFTVATVFAVAGVPVFTGVPVFAGVTALAVFPLVLASLVAGVPAVAGQYPGSGIRCLFDPWIRDPGWVKNQDPDPGSGAFLTHGSEIQDG
jgi:hypothetical protein